MDTLVSGIPAFCLSWALFTLLDLPWTKHLQSVQSLGVAFIVFSIGVVVFLCINGYLLAMDGQTLGKRLCRIRIVRWDGTQPTFWESCIKRTLAPAFIVQVPVVGQVFAIVDALFLLHKDRLCLHDRFAGTRVVRVLSSPSSVELPIEVGPPEEPSPVEEPTACITAGTEEILPAPVPENLELCPYCADLTSVDSIICRGCGRNPFNCDSHSANLALTVEELQKKAARLYGHRLDRQALDVHIFATRRFPNHKDAWQGLLNAANLDDGMQAEARIQLERISRTIHG